ncbi:hypothetical protein DBR32_07705 [Taibaiella sp. KBW10]|uniref:WG repeat-containing protein n=1 Tax=Taibaiella sp. KBW10 TaxID=2153357 RepID=UPI000F5A88B1|nr:hypothetical protein [Taibaiella sp. KBW10]RQO31816.1 hypothetical protein DBR32_07705 [Taibaiella sp. KBW10]
MKPVLTFLLLTIVHICSAQKIMIPYRSGQLFGLSDEQGKMILSPQYEWLQWMQGSWFLSSKQIAVRDSVEASSGKFFVRNITVTQTGLIHNGEEILKEEPFDYYEIVAQKCIVAVFKGTGKPLTGEQFKKYGQQRKSFSLFNLEGKNLYPESFKRIENVDTAGVSSKDKKAARYLLFVAMHFDNSYSMFVFDTDQQKISDWLVKNALKIASDVKQPSGKTLPFIVTDKQGMRSAKILDYSTGKFILHSGGTLNPPPEKEKRIERVEISEVDAGVYAEVAAPNMIDEKGSGKAPEFIPYHILIKDTLYYLKNHDKKYPVRLSKGGTVILTVPRGMTQYQPVIVKNENRFYIVKEDKPGAVAYDSLVYFGTDFLAWKTINGQTKAGLINANDSVLVPLQYDSIYAGIKLFNLKDKNPAGKPNYQIVLREADSKYDYGNTYPYKRTPTNTLTVFKGGKCGVITIKGDTIIPIRYDLIAQNDLAHSKPKVDDFLLLKQNGFYGIASLKYSSEQKRQELSFIAAPAFEYIPAFYYPDYFGVKGYKLIGLYNEQMEFKGYASEKGMPFYKD